MIYTENCLVCGSSRFREKYPSTFASERWQEAVEFFLTSRRRATHGRIVECLHCGFVFTDPQFTLKEYALIYANVPVFSGDEAAREARHRRLSREVRRFAGGGKLLDLGCGDGKFIANIHRDFQAQGIDIGPAKEMSAGGGPVIHHGDLIEVISSRADDWANGFDIITAWDILEHLPRPGELICALRRVISPGGHLLCTLPDISSPAARLSGDKWNCLLLEHLWYFNPDTLRKFMSDRGFELISVKSFPFATNPFTFIERLGQTFDIGFRFPKRCLPGSLVFHLPIGLMLAVFRPANPDSI